MAQEVELKFKDPTLWGDVTNVLCTMVQDALYASEDRDLRMLERRQANDMDSGPPSNPPYENSCELDSTLLREHHTMAMAQTVASWDGSKPQLRPKGPFRSDSANRLTKWAQIKAEDAGWIKARTDFAYIAHEQPCAIMYIGWKQKIKQRTKRRDNDGDPLAVEDGTPPESEGLMLDVDVEEQTWEFRVPDPWSVWPIPADAPSIEEAHGIAEELIKLRGEIIAGVDTEGYKLQAALDVAKSAPVAAQRSEIREEETQRSGIDSVSTNDMVGLVQIIQYWGKLPILYDTAGNLRIPEEFRDQDFLIHLCLQPKTILKAVYAPFDKNPYLKGSAIRVPNRWDGHSVGTLCSHLNAEDTINIRAMIDSINLGMCPPFIGSANTSRDAVRKYWEPLAVIPVQDPMGLEQLKLDLHGADMGAKLSADLQARADRLSAAENLSGTLGGTQRLATETNAATGVAGLLADLYLAYLNDPMTEAWQIMFSHARQFLVNGDQTVSGEEFIEITPDDLEQSYSISITAQSANVNPDVRRDRAIAIGDYVLANPLAANNPIVFYRVLEFVLAAMDGPSTDPKDFGIQEPITQPQLPPALTQPPAMPGMDQLMQAFPMPGMQQQDPMMGGNAQVLASMGAPLG